MKIKRKIFAVLTTILMITVPFSVDAADVKGDANGDGKLSIRDAAFIASCLAKNNELSQAADYNGDGMINVRDAAAIGRDLAVASAPSREEIILNIVNEERAKLGVAPLVLNTTMNEAAALRAQEITTLFSHTRPDGSSCFTVYSEFNISYNTAGENIAAGNSKASDTAQQWIDSPLHYENMTDPDFTEMGIGYAYSSSSQYGHYWVQIFR